MATKPRTIYRRSSWSGKVNVMVIEMSDEAFAELEPDGRRRRKIQDILPQASSVEREFLISGMSIEEQNWMFGDL